MSREKKEDRCGSLPQSPARGDCSPARRSLGDKTVSVLNQTVPGKPRVSAAAGQCSTARPVASMRRTHARSLLVSAALLCTLPPATSASSAFYRDGAALGRETSRTLDFLLFGTDHTTRR